MQPVPGSGGLPAGGLLSPAQGGESEAEGQEEIRRCQLLCKVYYQLLRHCKSEGQPSSAVQSHSLTFLMAGLAEMTLKYTKFDNPRKRFGGIYRANTFEVFLKSCHSLSEGFIINC